MRSPVGIHAKVASQWGKSRNMPQGRLEGPDFHLFHAGKPHTGAKGEQLIKRKAKEW